jgi:hypothetical protein
MDRPVLVPVRVLEGESVPTQLLDVLSDVPVVLLGYHVVPEQTAPGQARMQFEERALGELADVADATDGAVETRLVFTHDAARTIERVAVEVGAGSIFLVNPAQTVERVLVAVSSRISLDRIADSAAAIVADTGRSITVAHAASPDDDRGDAEALLSECASKLVERGVAPESITTTLEVSEAPIRTLIALAAEFDLAVVGESEPELLDRVFGDVPKRVAEESLTPTVIVRRLVEDGPRAEDVDADGAPGSTAGGGAADGAEGGA